MIHATIKIRQATATDLDEVSRLLAMCWHTTYDQLYGIERVAELTGNWHAPAQLAKNMTAPDTQFIVAEKDGAIIATAYATPAGNNAISLARLYVHPDHQGGGIGTALLSDITKAYSGAELVTLEVDPENKAAIGYYERHGFEQTGQGNDCGGAGDGIVHLIMTRRQ